MHSLDAFRDREPHTARDAAAEYKRMLAHLELDELRSLAHRWNVKLPSGSKAAITERLASRFAEPGIFGTMLGELADTAHQVLRYLHLHLAPEYGLSAESIVRGMLRYRQRAAQPARVGEPLPALYDEQWAQSAEMRRRIQEQIPELVQRGLLLPFKQNNTLYYTLPSLVRSYLPVQPSLVQSYTAQADAFEIQETPFGVLVHKLFATWSAISHGASRAHDPLRRHSGPPRQPIEDQWSALRGWDHEPSEIAILMKNQYPRGRSSEIRLDRVSAATLNWVATIPTPPLHLQEQDRESVRTQVQGTDAQIDFYYLLLESLGALSGEPGERIAVHRDALQRFLRLSASEKIQKLWYAWIADQPWAEMRAVLRREGGNGQTALRLRRSLAQHDYTAEDLYRDWDAGRKTVLRLLSLVPTDCWLSIDGVLKAVFDVRPSLLHTNSDPSVWWLESTRTGRQFGTAFEDWQQSYGQFVVSMLQGPLVWLGVVKLGYAPADAPQASPRLVAFQLTEAGAFALGRHSALRGSHPTDDVLDQSCCSISPDLIVNVTPNRAPLELHNLLHGVGRLLEATPDRFSYQLTADKIFGWLASDQAAGSVPAGSKASMDALIALLSTHCHPSDEASDEIWRTKLRTWDRNRGLLHLYENITLIELSDDYALQELLISTSLADHLVHQFSPRLVAIWADAIPTLVEEMEQQGYTPHLR